ncbi:unnamed protein product, partial [Polarella glacialis]
ASARRRRCYFRGPRHPRMDLASGWPVSAPPLAWSPVSPPLLRANGFFVAEGAATSSGSLGSLGSLGRHSATELSSSSAALGSLAAGLAVGVVSRRRGGRHRHRKALLRASSSADSGTEDGRSYFNVRTEVGEGIWTFEQEQSLANIAVNVRMTAIRLEDGGLWIHNPVAPTAECEELLRELGLPVRCIVLGTAQYEHKIFVGPFSRCWPEAKVYTVPQQWSWPIDLPQQAFGIFASGELKDRDGEAPWASEIEQRLLNPKNRLGFSYSAAECAFFHKRSRTLICTDALVFVPEEPPAVLDRRELQELGKTADNIVLHLVAMTNWRGSGDAVRDAQKEESAGPTPSEADLLRKGWQRDALLALFFGPDGRSILDPSQAFRAISGRWILGPVCYSLVYGGLIREEVQEWSEQICEWDFQQILPGHFAGPVRGNRDDVRRAFEVLGENAEAVQSQATAEPDSWLSWLFPEPVRYREQDIKLLTDIQGILRALKVI